MLSGREGLTAIAATIAIQFKTTSNLAQQRPLCIEKIGLPALNVHGTNAQKRIPSLPPSATFAKGEGRE